MSFSLSRLIIMPFVTIALIAGITMYFVSTVAVSSAVERIGSHYLHEVETRILDRISYFIAPLDSLVNVNQQALSQQSQWQSDLTSISPRLYEQSLQFPHVTYIAVATADGRIISSSHKQVGNHKHNFTSNFLGEPQTLERFSAKANGQMGEKIAEGEGVPYDPRLRPFYVEAVAANGPVWGDIEPYQLKKHLRFGLASAIYGQQGEVVGVTTASFELNVLDDYLESLELIEGALVFLAQPDGTLAATSTGDDLVPSATGNVTAVTLANQNVPLLRMAAKQLTAGQHELYLDGDHYLYRVHPIDIGYDETLLLGTLIPNSHHHSALAGYHRVIVAVILLLFLCIALIGSIISRYIAKPIKELNEAVNNDSLKRIQGLPIPLGSIDEINSLSLGLRQMADNLSDVMHNLEHKVAQRTSHLQNENENLLERAYNDELTQLYNRRGLKQACHNVLQEAQEQKLPLTFILCDIDHFKQVNDEYGHIVGDAALVLVANIFKNKTRMGQDIVARYGGEEFALVFTNINQEQVVNRLNRIRSELSTTPIVEGKYVTLSFGVTHLEEVGNTSLDALIAQTDEKLYQAKNSGRNKIVC